MDSMDEEEEMDLLLVRSDPVEEEVESAPLPWEALRMTEQDFKALVGRIRENPKCLRSSDGDGGFVRNMLTSTDDALTPRGCRQAIGWILAGSSPNEWLRDLKEKGNSTICGHIYKSDEMVFRCYSCATDPTCCVCSRCFEGSDCVAKGHQYQIFRAGAGGCCDCGDAEAWDPAGFCKRHSGPAVEDPIPTLPSDLRAVAEELLPIVLKFSTRAMRREEGEFGGVKGKFVVYLHNDAVHSFDEVERAVKKALRCSSSESKRLTRKAHDDGHTLILQSAVEAESRAAYKELANAGLICNITNEGYLEFEKRAAELFLLFRDISGGSNGLRRIMCNFLMEKDPIYSEKEGVKEGRGRYVDELMRADDNTWHDVQLALHDFHIQMIAEETYKNTFGDVFVELYSDLMFEVVNSRTEGNVSLLDLSVQIFTVNTVVSRLARENNLLEELFHVLNTIFDEEQSPEGQDPKRISVDSLIVENQAYMRPCRDIQYVLRIPGVAKLFCSRARAIRDWFLLLSRIQGMDPHTRQIQQHIEFEMRSWSYAFGLTMELVPLHVHIVKGFRESLGDYTGPEQKEVAMSLLKPAAEALGAWFRQCLVLEGAAACYQTFTDPEDGVLFATFKYDVSRQPISFQIPLHRFLTSCWAESIRWSEGQVELGPDLGAACGLYLPGTTELDAVATEQDCFPLALLEYPLRILIALAQNQAGMWVRNGLAIPGQQYAYIGPSLCEAMYETDITSVQLACCALGADAFVRILKKRFNVSKWLGGGPLTEGTETPEQAITILEEFIYVIILTLSERGALDDEGNEGIMKRRIIHRLAVGSQSHSALIRALPRSVADAKNFDQVLLEVGEYRRPDATQTGMFDLKAGLMEGVDPFSCYLSRKEREIVRELKRSKCGHVLPQFRLLPPCMSGLESLLVSPVLWNVFKRILDVALTNVSNPSTIPPYVTDTLLHEVLHIISMAVGYANQDKQRWSRLSPLLLDGGVSGVAGLLANLSVLAGGAVESCRFELFIHKQALVGLVAAMLEAGDELAALVKPLLPAAGDEDKGGDKDDKEERAKRQKDARERALAQMAEQQRAFAAMMDDSDDDGGGDDEMECGEGPHRLGSGSGGVATEDLQDEEGGQQCVLCHETADQTRPLGLICFAQASSVVSFSAGLRNNTEIAPGHMPELVRDCALNDAVIDGWERSGCERGHGVGTSFCGHAMHQDCLDRYLHSLELRLRTVDIGHGASVADGEFPCPLCRGLGNALVPILPREIVIPSEEKKDDAMDEGSKEPAPKDLSSLSVRELKAIATQNNVDITGCAEKLDIVNAIEKCGVTAPAAEKKTKAPLVNPATQGMLEKMAARMFSAHERMCRLRGERGLAMTGTFSSNVACVCSSAVYSLTAAEVNSRLPGYTSSTSKEGGLVSDSDLFHLTCLVRAARVAVEVFPLAEQWRWKKLTDWAMLLSGNSEGGDPGLTGHDVWGLFAHWLVLLDHKRVGLKEEFDGVLRIAWVAKMVQVISSMIAEGQCPKALMHLSGSEGEGPLETLVRLVASETGATSSGVGAAERVDVSMAGDQGEGNISNGGALKKQKSTEVVDIEDFQGSIAAVCLPFLRRACLLRAALFGVKLPAQSGAGQVSDCVSLLRFLQLPGKMGLSYMDGAVKTLVVGWCKQIKASRSDKALTTVNLHELAAPPKLHALPEWYHDLLKTRLKEKCTRCNTLPDEPAVCLLCGTLVCAGTECCRHDGEQGECTSHAISCGAGCAPYMFVKKCLLVIVRVGGGCRHSAPYLDAYGEEDPGLTRGRPLQLNNERYAKLLQLWSSHKLHAEVARMPQSRGGAELLWDSI